MLCSSQYLKRRSEAISLQDILYWLSSDVYLLTRMFYNIPAGT